MKIIEFISDLCYNIFLSIIWGLLMMEYGEILRRTDHTVLSVGAVWEDIRKACDEAVEYSAAAVCIPPSYVKQAAGYSGGRVRVCTVIGFPNGYSTTEVKCYEAANAITNGADELDAVINQGWVKQGLLDEIYLEIKLLKEICADKVLKVIIETCNLTDTEKILLARIVSKAGADYIKTSTGFAGSGATFEDVQLLAESVSNGVLIKASGGIGSLEGAQRYIELGAQRLGSSKLIGLVREAEKTCQ